MSARPLPDSPAPELRAAPVSPDSARLAALTCNAACLYAELEMLAERASDAPASRATTNCLGGLLADVRALLPDDAHLARIDGWPAADPPSVADARLYLRQLQGALGRLTPAPAPPRIAPPPAADPNYPLWLAAATG